MVVGPFFVAQKHPPIRGAFVLESDDSAPHAFHALVQAQGGCVDVPHELCSRFGFGREEPVVKVIGAVAAAEEFDVQHAGECARFFWLWKRSKTGVGSGASWGLVKAESRAKRRRFVNGSAQGMDGGAQSTIRT